MGVKGEKYTKGSGVKGEGREKREKGEKEKDSFWVRIRKETLMTPDDTTGGWGTLLLLLVRMLVGFCWIWTCVCVSKV